MRAFDESLPKRKWDNFHFVNFHQVTSNSSQPELAFVLEALLEIPNQYKKIKSLGLLDFDIILYVTFCRLLIFISEIESLEQKLSFKSFKEGVIVFCCANTTRSDRSQLLLVGESKRPRAVMIGMPKLPMYSFIVNTIMRWNN
ncbi:hypothetical protein Tsp_11938 [Trichinella spiralis]|uniref:hypothetical protein n=1 Tax=Trichinella spiralis TaxID=6334 RepID=UPI0001EFD210|nr:hypothetical protein Tsp_11938 [Trichinella spiralis]